MDKLGPRDGEQAPFPDERLDNFLKFMARLLARDLRDYPELECDTNPPPVVPDMSTTRK